LSIEKYKKINISEILKQLRSYKDITLLELSQNLNQKFNTTKQYEFENIIPPLETLIKLSSLFAVSIDFILISISLTYIKNINFLFIASKIDKLSSDKRYKIESTIETLLKNNDKSNFDTINIELSNNIHENIKILRKYKNMSQKDLANTLEQNQTSITHYEKSTNPTSENLIKLSEFFNVSIHYLITGQKLFFDFIDKAFENTVLKADKQFSLEDQKFIIKLMQNIINA